MSTPTVHHLENSRSHRILWLLEELGVEYELREYKRRAGGRAPRELRQIHALGKSPVVTHGSRVLAESGAIVEYLLDTFGEGRLRPQAGSDDHLRYRYYLHFAEGSLMPLLLVKFIMNRLGGAIPVLGRFIAGKVDGRYTDPELGARLEYVEADLEGRDWLAGELSGADIMMWYPLNAAIKRAGLGAALPNISGLLARMHARPAFVRAAQRGGAPGVPV